MLLTTEITNNINSGNIEVICGSMFSGKTEELIRRLKRAQIAKKKIAVFKPHVDARYNKSKIVSHNNNSFDSYVIKNAREILQEVENYNVIAVDEAQFFGDDLLSIINLLANKGKRIIVAGLDMDYLGNPFGIMGNILAISNNITKLQAICDRCSNLASYSFRKNNNPSLIHVGDKKEYLALCRKCFIKKHEL
jgi:thymidine kinase